MTFTIFVFDHDHPLELTHSKSTMSDIPIETSEIQRTARNVPEAVQPLETSNDIPTQRQLDNMHAGKHSLDAAMANLRDVDTGRMHSTTVAVAAHRRLYRSVCSAVRRLPIEVLQAIFFELSRDLGSSKGGYDVFDAHAGPWPLIHVSRLWRAAALGCTELWATLTVCRPDISRTRGKSALELRDPIALLRAALSHSGQRDLYIRFLDRSSPSIFLSVLVEHCNRWREVFLNLCPDDIYLLKDIWSRVPRLRALVYQPNDCLEFPDGAPNLALHKAPNLVELYLLGRPLGAFNAVLPQVVKLRYCEPKYTDPWRLEYDPLDVLSRCPNAEDVSIDPGANFTEIAWSAPLRVDVRALIRRDSITRFRTSDVRLLDYLFLPSLSDLSLSFTTETLHWEFSKKPILVSVAFLPTLLAFLKRSRCPLRQLTLHGADLRRSRMASLADIFTLTPELVRLEIAYGCDAFEFSPDELLAIRDSMSELVENLSNTNLLPNLAMFVFASFAPGNPAFTFANADFFAMCATRQPILWCAALHCIGCSQKGFPTLRRDVRVDGVSGVAVSVHGNRNFFAMLRGEEETCDGSGSGEE